MFANELDILQKDKKEIRDIEKQTIEKKYDASKDEWIGKINLSSDLSKGNSADYEGGYLVGETESLTIAKLKSLEGKIVYIHMPATCKQGNKNVCARCVGDKVAQSGVSIPAQQNAICNVFMSVALAAFHGSSLSTNQVKLKDHLRTSKL
jgi:hypothetical protein